MQVLFKQLLSLPLCVTALEALQQTLQQCLVPSFVPNHDGGHSRPASHKDKPIPT
jgi:hypothetical protein